MNYEQLWCTILSMYMGLVTRKPVLGVSDQEGLKLLCSHVARMVEFRRWQV